MKLSLHQAMRWTLVVTLTTFLSTGPVSAGWLLKRYCGGPPVCAAEPVCQPAPVCAAEPVCQPAPVYAPAPACCPEPACAPAPIMSSSSDCCGGEMIGNSVPMMSGESILYESSPMMDSGMMSGEVIVPSDNDMPPTVSVPAPEDTENMAPPVLDPAPKNSVAKPPTEDAGDSVMENTNEPSPFDAPPVPTPDPIANETDAAATAPETTQPPVSEPEENLFDVPAETPTPDAAMPADDAAGLGDLFDTPAETATPDAAMPADDAAGLGDLFDAPAEAATPDAAMPADDGGAFGDLFDAPAEAATPDAAMPADDGGAFGDLFDTPAESATPDAATPADGGLDDLFDAPATPDATPPADGGDLDDIFSSPAVTEPVEGGALDDLFGQQPSQVAEKTVSAPQPARVATAIEQTVPRQWIDNTGTFRTEGRLIKIADDHVKLLKSNGKTCTVPMERLSDEDSDYVRTIAERMETFVVAMAGE